MSEKCLAYKHIDFIKLIVKHKNNPNRIKGLMNLASSQEINTISEIVHNFLSGSLPLSKDAQKYFCKNAKFLRFVGAQKKSGSKKRKLLCSTKGGSIIAPLLSIAIPILLDLFNRPKE